MSPLVSCLCLTQESRVQFFNKAVELFKRQTYPNLELVVVTNGDKYIAPLFESGSHYRVLHIGDANVSVGELRNLGCSIAAGQFICHWDDDDWYAADYVQAHMNRLPADKSVSGYHLLHHFDVRTEQYWMYKGCPNTAVGSTLFYRRYWWQTHKFRHTRVGQDEEFALQAFNCRQLINGDSFGFTCATIHGDNTSPKVTTGAEWTKL